MRRYLHMAPLALLALAVLAAGAAPRGAVAEPRYQDGEAHWTETPAETGAAALGAPMVTLPPLVPPEPAGPYSIQLPFLVFNATGEPVAPTIIQDDTFDETTLNGRWTFFNPREDAAVILNGTHAEISVPGGVAHDVWTGGNFAPRLMQPANNTDFDVTAKFDSLPSGSFASQGLIIEQDARNFLRYDIYSEGTSYFIFVASFRDGAPSRRVQAALRGTPPQLLRVRRFGNSFVMLHSVDGRSWTIATSFSYPMTVTAVGVFAGNAGSAPPAHTARVDAFFNTLP
jgi:hypothetical protein